MRQETGDQRRAVERPVVGHPAPYLRVDEPGYFQPSEVTQRCSRQERTSVLIFFRASLLIARAGRGELLPHPYPPCLPWPVHEPEERERRVLMRAAPVAVLAVHDLGLVRMQLQADLGHPLMQRGQDLAGLVLTDAVDHRVICVPLELD